MPTDTTFAPEADDVHVGRAVRARRRQIGMSQEGLANEVGVSFQQVQKYENAANRVSCSMLMKIARALRCRAADLLPDGEEGPARTDSLSLQLNCVNGGSELAGAFLRLNSRRRKALLIAAEAMLDDGDAPAPRIASPERELALA